MDELIKEIRDYLRLEENDDSLLGFVEAAKLFIERSTGAEFNGADDLYKMAIKMLVAHWYENRGAIGQNTNDIPFSVDALMKHIRICGDYHAKA